MSRALWTGTAVTATALLGRAACQAATFLIVARELAPALYGQFVAIVCIGIMVAPAVTAGVEYVMVSLVATQRASTASCLGGGLYVLALLAPAGLAAAGLYVGLALEADIGWCWTLALLSSEIVLVPLLELCWRAFQANERMTGAGLLRSLPAVFKLVAAALLALGFYDANMANWALAYTAATALGAGVAVSLARREFDFSFDGPAAAWDAARTGWPFAAYSLAERTTNDVDKLMLASLVDTRGAGLYAGAYRLVEVFIMPVMAGLMTVNAAIYRAGAASRASLRALLWKLGLGIVAYGLFAATAITAGADLVGVVLGEAYAGSAEALVALSVLPMFYGLRVLLGFGLASSGRQLARMVVQCGAAATSVVLCLAAIPTFGLTGAALATVGTEVLTLCVLSALLARDGELQPAA